MRENLKITLAVGAAIFLATGCQSKQVKNQSPQTPQARQEIAMLEERLQTDLPKNEKAAIYEKLARLYLQKDNYVKAVELLKNAQNEGGSIPHINHYMGSAYYGKSDYKNAISYFRKSEMLDGGFGSSERKVMMIKSYFEEGDYGRGLGLLGKLSRERGFKKDSFYYRSAALGFFKIREYRKSHVMLKDGLKKYPDDETLLKLREELSRVYNPN